MGLTAGGPAAVPPPDAPDASHTLETPGGKLPLHEYHLRLADRSWSVLHSGAVISFWEEQRLLGESRDLHPYGVALWPAAIALAHELSSRGTELRGRMVLELGAGTGLPGIVAASLGARVVQTDRNELALSVCRRNGGRNPLPADAPPIEHRVADWTKWDDGARYDWIVGADVIYSEPMHPHLRHIFESNLAPGGRVLLSDPFRSMSLRLLTQLDEAGWRVAISKWSVGGDLEPRPIGVYELTAPR